jgi:hypothetical protein
MPKSAAPNNCFEIWWFKRSKHTQVREKMDSKFATTQLYQTIPLRNHHVRARRWTHEHNPLSSWQYYQACSRTSLLAGLCLWWWR